MKKVEIPWRKYVIISVVLIALYFVTRLVNLTKLPIFTDEAIYIRWSQIGSRDSSWRFISLVDGKQPLFTWILMVYLKVIKSDPLFVGRLVSVSAGFASLVGIWFLTKELFKKNSIAFIAAFLYIISPFSLMYDRLALYESLVSAFSIWNLYIALLFVKNPRLDLAMIMALTLGAGMLNKSSGFLSLYFLPFTLFLFDWKGRDVKKRLLRWFGFALCAAVLSQVYYSVLRLSPLFNMIKTKNAVFVYPMNEWLQHPFQFLLGNLNGLVDWTMNYLTIPIFISAILSAVVVTRNFRQKALLVVWWSAPLVGLALFARVLYPRYALFMSMPLLILSATTIYWVIEKLGKKVIGFILLGFFLFQAIVLSYLIITNPIEAPLPLSDRSQMLDDWPAGGGIAEVNQFFGEKAKGGKLAVYTDGTFGLLPAAIEMYYVDNPNIEIHGLWPLSLSIPEEMLKKSLEKPTYMILNQYNGMPDWPMKLIASYNKGKRQDRSLRLYQVEASKSAAPSSL
jgi:4-amino-4-deoxy-L-arabinose transferase-like glycosyltransferase